MDGLEATRRLRALQDLHDVPVITLSAGAMQDAAKSLEAGANGFLTKPLHLEALLREIEAQLKVTWVYDGPLKTPAASAPDAASRTGSPR
jgi:CheY-like chemotaxis protein